MRYEEEKSVADDALNQTSAEKEEVYAVIIAKAVLGAILGAIPSMFLWIVLGKVGYLASIV